MRKSFLLIPVFIVFILSSLNAQLCGFDQVHKKLLSKNPDYARRVRLDDELIHQYISAHPEKLRPQAGQHTLAAYTIPVVVHVMHTGGAVGTIYNPDDAQILGAIDYLNSVYAGTFPGMLAPVEGGGVVDMEIQFALAQRTPTCGATNGIDRVDLSSVANYVANGVNIDSTEGISDLALKNLARWDPSSYYNVWVVNKIDEVDGTSGQFIAGYAQFAGGPANQDGTVMLATQMISGQKTLPHEIGHALNLYHTFQGSDNNTECPPSTDCTNTGDQVCDTDPISNNFDETTGFFDFSCRTGQPNLCASPNNYTINTESNFMSYTNCYNLFTNGQKARVQAAMSLLSRQSLVDGSNLALTPCGTTVNFSQASAVRSEDINGTLTDCRRYTDFTYKLAIGAAPSATATATLTYSGTATKGVDYDVTTNGDFDSPSDVLSFASGSTLPQSFIVRIYDDGEVESSETAIIDFTLDDGGGDATKGTTTPTFTFTIDDNDVAPTGNSTVDVITGNNDVGLQQPFNGIVSDGRTQMLFTKADLNNAGLTGATIIQTISFSVVQKNSTGPFNGFTVRMKNTTSTSYEGGSFETGGTQVFTGNYTTALGLNTITLSSPFTWNGADHLLVDICFDNSTAPGSGVGYDVVVGTGGIPQCHFSRVDGSSGCSLTDADLRFTGGGARPDIEFTGELVPTPVETAASSSSDMHITNVSNDYFYSNNNKLLMRLRGISAPLGCVNSTLEEAGSNWVNYGGGERSAKVFTVTPTTNGGSASYTIDLYFDNSELDGKDPATLRLAKTDAASVADANGSNTIIVTPTVSTLGSDATVFTASFTGFSRFFLIDASVALPIGLLEFSGKVNEQKNTVLKWTTAWEQNNKEFDVEVSDDGVHFVSLGTVASQGNSTTNQYYEFIHTNPQPGKSWYRLKQVDFDGHFKYSDIISITIDKDKVKPFVYPVPAGDILTVDFGHITHKAEINLFTSDMKSVRYEKLNGLMLKKDINIADLAKGIYFIRVTTEEGTQLLRFIKR